MKRFKNLNITNKLVILFVAATVILTSAAGYIIINISAQYATSQIKERYSYFADAIMNTIDMIMAENYHNIKSFAQNKVFTGKVNTPEEMTQYLKNKKEIYGFVSLSYFDMNRIRIADTEGLDIGIQHEMVPYWEDVLSGKVSAGTDIRIAEELKIPIIYFASPVKNKENKSIGVVVARYDPKHIYEMIKNTREKGVDATLFDKKRNIIVTTCSKLDSLERKGKIPEYLSVKSALSGQAGTVLEYVPFHKKDFFSAYTHEKGFADFKGNDWSLVISIDKDVAFAPIRKLESVIFVVLIIVVLVVLLTAPLIAYFITRPILKLSAIARGITKGDLTLKAEVTALDEVGELAGSFNQMTDSFIKVREELISEKTYTEEIISSMADSLVVVDPAGRIKLVNKATLDLLGYKKDELIGQPLEKIFLQGEGEKEGIFHRYFKRIIELGVLHNVGLTFVTKQGKEIPINFSAAVIREGEKITGMVGIARDMRKIMVIIGDLEKKDRELEERSENLTRMQRAMLHMMDGLDIAKKEVEKVNKKLRELNQIKSDFVSTVSHELRTPLATMREFTAIILDEIPGKLTKEQKEYVGIIKGNIDRLSRLINDLLDISKIESGRKELKKVLVDIAGLANSVISVLRPEAQAKHIEFKTLFPAAALNVYADPDEIVQVFTNLIENAIKFTNEFGEIIVEIRDTKEELACSIADTGIGIAPENLDKIFGKFQQVDREAGAGAKGTGLGLAISKKLVEMHNGRIWAESKSGKGSKFIFTLPKHSKEDTLRLTVEEKIAWARKGYKDFSIFIIRLDDYSEFEEELGKDKAQQVFLPALEGLEGVMRSEGFLTIRSENEVIMFAQVNKQEASGISARFKRKIKEHIFEIGAHLKKGFSYGYATYPDDADNAKDLVERVYKSCVQEREARLKKSIMIIDDEPESRNILKKVLQAGGYSNFSEAGDGEEALGKIRAAIPDLLIIDLIMPRMGGYELIGMLKEDTQTKDIPVLIMSGYAIEIDNLKEYVKKKAIPVVGKPFNIEQLKKLINYLL